MNNLNEQEYDMTKKMIDVMRNGTTKKHVVEEQDITRKMLDTIRNGRRLITEAEEVQPGAMPGADDSINNVEQDEPEEVSDMTDSEDLEGAPLTEEQKSFMDTVSPKVDFEGFKIYRKDRNVVFNGNFQDLNGVQWSMSLKAADGLNISAQSLKLDKDTIRMLYKLYGFYENWSKEWATKLNTEYKYTEEEND